MNFIGIDPGLTAPAVCVMDEQGNRTTIRTIRTGKLKGTERLCEIVERVLMDCRDARPAIVSIEDYAYSRNAKGQRASIEAVGVLKWELWREYVPVIQSIGPMQLKKYVTGGGRADKQAMMDAARSEGVDVLDDNQADAWGLAMILRDTWRLVTQGERPKTLYRFEVCESLAPWIQEHAREGVSA